jgi:hypothetical protein
MDCHLSDTKWKLIGVFKISNLSGNNGFLDLLLKHQGACLWDDDKYKIVYKMKYTNPEGCKSTKKTLADGTPLYYGAKPQAGGNITLGLYTDNMCSTEYSGKTTYDVFSLVGSDKSYWVSFNDALDVFKQCQPCVSYDVSSSDFECYDKAGYTNVNQVSTNPSVLALLFGLKSFGCVVSTRYFTNRIILFLCAVVYEIFSKSRMQSCYH